MDTLKQYLPLCWLTSNPLELTRSVRFFKQNLLFYFIIEFFMQANMTDDPFESFSEVCIETLLTLFFIAVMLSLNKTMYAFIQVTTAILFCENIVAVSIVPILVWLTITEDLLSYYVLGALLIWSFTLITYILKKVLSINTPASAVLALFYFASTYFGAFALGQL